jgi:predicted GNAT superfamily acetyltransferase
VTGRMGEVPASVVAEAQATADAADARSGVRTRPAAPGELDGVLARFEATWGAGRGFDRATLQAVEHAGNTVLVAVEMPVVEERPAQPDTSRDPGPAVDIPLGATLGFLGWSGGLHLHSHMNAVDPAARGRGIGVALKLRQRAVCLAHGVTEMRWTYDPLIRRNAHLNLVRLGAEVIAFHPDFYGDLRDAITGADHSDRFEVRWRLDAARTLRALARGAVPEWRAEGGLALVADYEVVRAEQPDLATRLRAASRDAFAALADGSGLRAELDANGDYVFTRDDPDREAS